MSKESYRTLQPKVSVLINGVALPVNRIDLNNSVDQLPFAAFEVQLNSQGVEIMGFRVSNSVALNLDEFNKLNVAIQNKLLNDFRLGADTVIRVEDGQGGVLNFPGHLGRPEFSLVNGLITLRFSMVHLSSNLQALNTSIYRSRYLMGSPFGADALALYNVKEPFTVYETEPTVGIFPRQLRTDSIADRIATFALYYMVMFNHTPKYTPNYNYYTGQIIHNLNILAWPYFRDVLKESRDMCTIAGISEPVARDEFLNKLIQDVLLTTLNGWDVLRNLSQQFIMQLVAGWDTPIRMEHSLTMSQAEGRKISVPVEMVRFAMANIFELPMRQAVVQGLHGEYYGLNGLAQGAPGLELPAYRDIPNPIQVSMQEGFPGPNILAGYPVTVSNDVAGSFYVINPPEWLGVGTMSGQDRFSYIGKHPATAPVQDPTDRMVDARGSVEHYKKIVDSQVARRVALMRYYAQKSFFQYYLSGTSAMVSMPLNVSSKLQTGRVYEVQTLDGHPLFTGYLVSVVHQVSVDPQGGRACTMLNFSHVLATGVALTARGDDLTDLSNGTIRSITK